MEEILDENFEISDGVTIEAGEYGFFQGGIGFDTDRSRPVSFDASVKWGEFYDGERLRLSLEAEWRASKFWGIEAGGDYFDIDLPAGDLTNNITSEQARSFSGTSRLHIAYDKAWLITYELVLMVDAVPKT